VKRALFLVLTLALASLATLACKRRARDELAAQLAAELAADQKPDSTALPPLRLTDDTSDLLLTWIDAKGDPHEQAKPADVPMEGRDRVRVVVTTSEDGTRDPIYVADLTGKNADGTYRVSTMARTDWESMMAKRRAARLETAGGAPAPSAAPAPQGPLTAIVYGAAWCDACHEAAAYLRKRRVSVVEKDIEKDPAAEAEMRAKLARVGKRSASIPIIDVRGSMVVGFDPQTLDQAIASALGGAR
jgi:glutaredoxin